MTPKTGLVWHELYMWHATGQAAGIMPYGFPVEPYRNYENPDAKRRIKNLLDAAGVTPQLSIIAPRPATDDELARVHTRGHIARMAALNDQWLTDAGAYSPVGVGSIDVARLAAGGAVEAVDAVMKGQARHAYALVRPPGHHAMPDEALGFCIFCNTAVAGAHALEVGKAERIAIVDWDVHHGNGTQAAFYDDPRALTISIHQDGCFPPGTGEIEERGAGDGEGCTINIPLPPGSGNGAYKAAMDRIIVPALEKFKPELIIVACGFDAGAHDQLGRMMVSGDGFRYLTGKLVDVADHLCPGRIVMCHEGGYCPSTAPFFGLAVIETLSGIESGVADPFEEMLATMRFQELQPHQDEALRRVEEAIR